MPVIIEDDVFIGGNCGVYEGTCIKSRAVLASGVIVNKSSVLYDLVNDKEIRAGTSGNDMLEIPEGAVVIPGARQIERAYGRALGLSRQVLLLVKYRDEKTDSKTILEQSLREVQVHS